MKFLTNYPTTNIYFQLLMNFNVGKLQFKYDYCKIAFELCIMKWTLASSAAGLSYYEQYYNLITWVYYIIVDILDTSV